MNGTDIVKLAVDLAAGATTASVIEEQFGEGVLTSVLALAAGGATSAVAHTAMNVLDNHTGIVSDVGSLVDDVLDLF